MNEIVDDASFLGRGRCVEAAGETIEELGEAEAACVAGLESSRPLGEPSDASLDLVELDPSSQRSVDGPISGGHIPGNSRFVLFRSMHDEDRNRGVLDQIVRNAAQDRPRD